jgi:hypothetical protein
MLVKSFLSFFSVQKKSLHAPKQSPKQFETERQVRWVQHMDAYGNYYYEDTINNTVTWMAPIGEEYVPWADKSNAPKQSPKRFEAERQVRWVQHMDPVCGMYYYEDTINGTVTWMAPVGEEYAQSVDIQV